MAAQYPWRLAHARERGFGLHGESTHAYSDEGRLDNVPRFSRYLLPFVKMAIPVSKTENGPWLAFDGEALAGHKATLVIRCSELQVWLTPSVRGVACNPPCFHAARMVATFFIPSANVGQTRKPSRPFFLGYLKTTLAIMCTPLSEETRQVLIVRNVTWQYVPPATPSSALRKVPASVVGEYSEDASLGIGERKGVGVMSRWWGGERV